MLRGMTCRWTLLTALGKDSGLLTHYGLKTRLQQRIHLLSTDNEVIDFLNNCLYNMQVNNELEWLNQYNDLDKGSADD